MGEGLLIDFHVGQVAGKRYSARIMVPRKTVPTASCTAGSSANRTFGWPFSGVMKTSAR